MLLLQILVWLGHSNCLSWSISVSFSRVPHIRKSSEETRANLRGHLLRNGIIAVQTVLQSTWGCCISGTRNRRESIPHPPSLSLLSSSIWRRHKNAGTSWPRTSISHPPIIHALIGGTRVGHRDVLHDKAIRGNFPDGQVSRKGNREIERERLNIPQRGQRDAKRYAIGKVFAENLRRGSRTRDSDVPSFLSSLFLSLPLSLCYGFRWDLPH